MRVVDLFAGVGGLSFGFAMANFETVFAIEHDESIANTYKLNHPNTDVFSTDIEKLNLKDLTKKYNNSQNYESKRCCRKALVKNFIKGNPGHE